VATLISIGHDLWVSENSGLAAPKKFDLGSPLPLLFSPIFILFSGSQRHHASTGCFLFVTNSSLVFKPTDVLEE
jgi:hypothetical protein